MAPLKNRQPLSSADGWMARRGRRGRAPRRGGRGWFRERALDAALRNAFGLSERWQSSARTPAMSPTAPSPCGGEGRSGPSLAGSNSRSTAVFCAAVAGTMSVVDSDMGSSSGRNESRKILVDPSGDAPSLPGPGESARRTRHNVGYRVSRAAISATCQPQADYREEHPPRSREIRYRRS